MKPAFKILLCVGTRPNFIKISKFKSLLAPYPHVLCEVLHTGQHFDKDMSDVFFKQLGIGIPDYQFPAQTGTQIQTIASIMQSCEQHLLQHRPHLVMVPGDVNSSLACALAASRLGIPVAHIESGLRSFDRSMPEEINRILIDDLSDLLFVTEQSGLDHLKAEGKDPAKVHFVGNTMIDSIELLSEAIAQQPLPDAGFREKGFAMATFHRPSNVDDPEQLQKIIDLLSAIAEQMPVCFPLHPRTRLQMEKNGLSFPTHLPIKLLPPMDYIGFLGAVSKSAVVITDSGGIQEESTYLGIPCLTIRENTERPITITHGTNTLLSNDINSVIAQINAIRNGTYKKGQIPPLWDGRATERIIEVLLQMVEG